MEKRENVEFFLPHSWAASTPPGFPPQSLETRSSAAAGLSTNPNPSPIENEPAVHGLNQTPRRRTPRKRSRPQFYAPATPPNLAAAPRRRRGRPPKSGFVSRLAHLETVTSDGNRVSPIESMKPPEQRSSFISSLPISKDKSSLQVNDDQVVEHDSEILQRVANALQYMIGNQTAVADENVLPRSSGFNLSLIHTLGAINKKHGDITRGCLLQSDCMKTVVLLGICKVVQDLQSKQIKDLDINGLDSYYTAVRDAENMKVDVQWLRSRLDEIGEACKLSDEAKILMDERDRQVKIIDETKKKLSQRRAVLERLRSEVQVIEEQLAQEVVTVEELNKKFGNQRSKISRFQHANLMDGLI